MMKGFVQPVELLRKLLNLIKNWEKKNKFIEILENYKKLTKDEDCIIPVGGGKDIIASSLCKVTWI